MSEHRIDESRKWLVQERTGLEYPAIIHRDPTDEEWAGRAVQDDGLDVERLIRAWGKHRDRCRQAMWGKACIASQCADSIAAEYNRLRAAPALQATGEESSLPENPPQKFLADSPNDEG